MKRYVAFFAGAALLLSTLAHAEYPEKPIEFIIPFGAGGGADIEGRMLAREMSRLLGVPVVPINKPGAGGAVTYTYVKNAKPDGYTVAWNSTSLLTSTNIGNVPFRYDALDPIGRAGFEPMVFAVKGDAKWRSMKDFAAECAKRPGALKVGNSGTGSGTHIAAIAMVGAVGCKVIHVPLGIKRRNAGLLSGEVDAMAAPLTGSLKLQEARQIRMLAHLSGGKVASIPDVPSMKALGHDVELDLFRGLSVPKGTPAAVKAKLGEALGKAARSKEYADLAAKSGFTVAPLDAAAFGRQLAQYDETVRELMKKSGLYQSEKGK